MARRTSTTRTPPPPDPTRHTLRIIRMEVYGSLLTLFASMVLIALATSSRSDLDLAVGTGESARNFMGPVGAHMADLFLWTLGAGSFALAGLLLFIGIRAVVRRPVRFGGGPVAWTIVALLMLVVLLDLLLRDYTVLGYPPAGRLGLYAGPGMEALLSRGGALLVSGATFAIAVTYLAGSSLGSLLRALGRLLVGAGVWIGSLLRDAGRGIARGAVELVSRRPSPVLSDVPGEGPGAGPQPTADDHDTVIDPAPAFDPAVGPRWSTGPGQDAAVAPPVSAPPAPGPSSDSAPEPAASTPAIIVPPKKVTPATPPTRVADTGHYDPPPLSLLDFVESKNLAIDDAMLRRNAETLERKLQDYRVEGRVVEIHPGPVVTMYEFLPAPGVKISQIANLADDLTMALEAVSIRIVAPIPGKGVVGIEVPNAVRETVYLREVLASEPFVKAKTKLTLALGKDIFGTPVVTDLSKMPHLLIAGATGSGKSVAVNAFILSLLAHAGPDEVRMILVDPKVVELQVYEGIPHLLLPVVYDPKHAAAALRWAVEEMERRYELLARYGTRNVQSFNQRIDRLTGRDAGRDGAPHPTQLNLELTGMTSVTRTAPDDEEDELKRLPYIVIVLDEFADLMMVASKDVETAVARLAQKARAAGIHLVMATQRPSKEVITGLIKANFPSRIAFRVSSKIDSRIILDQSGADALLGFGDMLFLRPGTSLVTRIHGPFVSDEEVARVVEHVKKQGSPDYKMEILQQADGDDEEDEEADTDPLLDDAQDIVVSSRRASISFLQRKLKIGYNRSARIMEQLERRNVVGPPDSRGERQVLMG
jgi:S-DNA-T family DNA segregation ATPase FtsK/SpoIIIE